ncbi:MAG: hypothetical protein GY765_14685 [bacterium]|nr:hypothetical protein [bacterium]
MKVKGGPAGKSIDIVSTWFHASGTVPPDSTGEVCFQFFNGVLAVTSNSSRFLENITDRLRHYRISPGEAATFNGCITRAEVFTIEGPTVGEGIVPPPAWNGLPIDYDNPGEIKVYKTDSFYHLKSGIYEAFHRPNDLLVSFPAGHHDVESGFHFSEGGSCHGEGRAIRILISETADTIGMPGGRALKKKGAVNWEEISDMVHMLYMRVFGFFCIHAASLNHEGRGVILTGASGSGKSTSALALIDKGARLLSDELTLVPTGGEDDMSIAGIILDPRLTHVDEECVYNVAPRDLNVPNWEKKTVPMPEEAVSLGKHTQAEPGLILFMDLKKDNGPKHAAFPVDPHEALTALMAQVLDPSNSTRHREIFDAIYQLLDKCALYRLEPGRDIESLPAFIAGLQ